MFFSHKYWKKTSAMSQNKTEKAKKQSGPGRNRNQDTDSSAQRKISTFVSRIDNLAIRNEPGAVTSHIDNTSRMALRSDKESAMADVANEELSLRDMKAWMDTKFTAIIQQNEETKVQINALVGRTEKTESDVFELKQQSDKLERENTILKEKLENTMEKVLVQEAQQKKTNLRLYNVPENAAESAITCVEKYIGEVLGLTAKDHEGVTDAFRVGRPPQPGADRRPRQRTIIARFTSQREATRVKLAAWKLKKGTSDVGVGEDLPQEWAQARSRAFLTIVKPAKQAGKTVRWRGAKCYVDGVLVDTE